MTAAPEPAPRSAESFIELRARDRARAILDAGSFAELLGPFERLHSPWLQMQGTVPQEDDGVIVARGLIGGARAVVIALEGAFQAGSIGEVGGAKIATALELALQDAGRGRPVCPVLLLETGGVRLQEATLGLTAVARIQSAVVALREQMPVIGVIAGLVGCFGGMSLVAGLCSWLIVTRQGRLGMNGPEVIEHEAGVEEMDAADRRYVWSIMGGEQRHAQGLADELVCDDCAQIAGAVRAGLRRRRFSPNRSQATETFIRCIAAVDPLRPPDPRHLRSLWPREAGAKQSPPRAAREDRSSERIAVMQPSSPEASRGRMWLEALVTQCAAGTSISSLPREAGAPVSVLCAEAHLGGEPARFLAVVPDRGNRFPRARHGEMGVREAWGLAAILRRTIEADRRSGIRRPLIAIVDTAGQAYGRMEELVGIHLAFAAAVDAYASARLAGHPVVALIVGRAISGAFLAHGLQASCLLALDDPGVMVHVMPKEAAALVLRRPVAELEALGETALPMSYDIRAFARLGLLHRLITGVDADAPSQEHVARVAAELVSAVARARNGPLDSLRRVVGESISRAASATIEVQRRLAQQWDSLP